MIYLDYEMYRLKYLELQEQFNAFLTEKERLFTKTQPNAIRYDKEKVQVPFGCNVLEEYVISLDETKIDEKLDKLRQIHTLFFLMLLSWGCFLNFFFELFIVHGL